MRVPLFVVATRERALRAELSRISVGIPLADEEPLRLCDAWPGSSVALLCTDCLADPLVRQVAERLGEVGSRTEVWVWGGLNGAHHLLRIPDLFVHDVDHDWRGPARSLAALARVETIVGSTSRDYPPSLRLAVRRVVRMSSDADLPPPPRTVGELALAVGCARETLSRTSTQHGVDLPHLLDLARVRWIRCSLGAEPRTSLTLARAIGYTSPKGLRRLLKRVGVPSVSRLLQVSLLELDKQICEALGGSADSAAEDTANQVL